MENKKEPLMSVYQYYSSLNAISYSPLSFAKAYAKYHTQWHLNNAKDFVADGVRHSERGENDYDYPIISKQSIHTAIDNYIKDNL